MKHGPNKRQWSKKLTKQKVLGVLLALKKGPYGYKHGCNSPANTESPIATTAKSLKELTMKAKHRSKSKLLRTSNTKTWNLRNIQKVFKPWKLLKMSHLNFWILAISTNFCPIKIDLSGNTVWPQASGFQKLAKMDHFWHF